MKTSGNTKPHLIVMVGIPRSGKSFFAEHFADTFKAPIINFDRLRKEIFTNPSFNNEENKTIFKVANYMLDEVFKTKRTIIYEGLASLRSDRIEISKKAKNADYETLFIWVQTETASAKKRALKTTIEKPALSSDEFDNKIKHFSKPHKNEKAIVISGKHTYASQLKIVLKHLIQPHDDVSKQNNPIRAVKHRNFLIR